jgi:ribosomal protein S18 acetylase RimI-like enzyme
VIRPARADDGPALRALDTATWAWWVTPGPDAPPDKPFFGANEAPGDVLVAEEGGAVVGYVALGSPTRLESNRHVMDVRGLAVAPDHQRRGLGRALLEAAAAEARARGARRLRLRVLSANSGAQALYESCGFQVEGVLRGEFLLDGRYVDDVLMARELTTPPRSTGEGRAR